MAIFSSRVIWLSRWSTRGLLVIFGTWASNAATLKYARTKAEVKTLFVAKRLCIVAPKALSASFEDSAIHVERDGRPRPSCGKSWFVPPASKIIPRTAPRNHLTTWLTASQMDQFVRADDHFYGSATACHCASCSRS